MSVDQRNLPAYLSNNTDFQTWVQGIHAQLVAAGLIQTADTGQINSATVALPGAINTAAGYEIFRFNDTGVANGQSVNPVFIKVEYGTGIGAVNRQALWFTVGSGSNGSGTITGVMIPRTQVDPYNNSQTVGTTLQSDCAGDGGWFGLVTNIDTSNNQNTFYYILDRIRDGSGVPTGEGLVALYPAAVTGNQTPNIYSWIAGATNNTNPTAGGPFGWFPGPTAEYQGTVLGGGQRIVGTNVGILPLMTLAGQLRFLKAGVVYAKADFGSLGNVQFVANNLGGSHNYMTLPNVFHADYPAHGNDSIALLWE